MASDVSHSEIYSSVHNTINQAQAAQRFTAGSKTKGTRIDKIAGTTLKVALVAAAVVYVGCQLYSWIHPPTDDSDETRADRQYAVATVAGNVVNNVCLPICKALGSAVGFPSIPNAEPCTNTLCLE